MKFKGLAASAIALLLVGGGIKASAENVTSSMLSVKDIDFGSLSIGQRLENRDLKDLISIKGNDKVESWDLSVKDSGELEAGTLNYKLSLGGKTLALNGESEEVLSNAGGSDYSADGLFELSWGSNPKVGDLSNSIEWTVTPTIKEDPTPPVDPEDPDNPTNPEDPDDGNTDDKEPVGCISSQKDKKYMYCKIQNEHVDDKGDVFSNIWGRFKMLKDGTVSLDGSSTVNKDYDRDDNDNVIDQDVADKLREEAIKAGTEADIHSGDPKMTGNLIIPDTVDGLKVTRIEDHVFCRSNMSGHLHLPKYVTYIGYSAFTKNQFTGAITIPDEVKTINEGAFFGAKFTGELKLPESLTYLGPTAFNSSEFTGNLVLPDGLTSIGHQTFTHSNFTGDLTIPKGMKEIGWNAFYSSEFSGKLNLPEGFEKLGTEALQASKFTNELVLPSSLNYLGDKSLLKSNFTGNLSLPANLTYLGSKALGGSSISKVKNNSTTPTGNKGKENVLYTDAIRMNNGADWVSKKGNSDINLKGDNLLSLD